MPTQTFENITLTVWAGGVQICKTGSPNMTFISKNTIGSLFVIKDSNGSYIRYIPLHSHSGTPVDLATWWSEKLSNDHAFPAFNFILEWLYNKPCDGCNL
jgi:hypothetical protein